jgi:hypothetical protein
VAEELGETEDFVLRVRDRFAADEVFNPGWFRSKFKIHHAMCLVASTHDGLASYAYMVPRFAGSSSGVRQPVAASKQDLWDPTWGVGYRMSPCRHCGSLRRAYLGIKEPDGPVCLDCRLDNAGRE